MPKLEPISQVTMQDSRSPEVSVDLVAKIDGTGDLVLEGVDSGPLVGEVFHDSDYEYWLTVEERYKDTVLLLLIQERFDGVGKFQKWLAQQGIPSEFSSS